MSGLEITEVRFAPLIETFYGEPLAFFSFTIADMIVVHEAKILETDKGLLIVMPSRKLTDRCIACGAKNHLKARHCNGCGTALAKNRPAPVNSYGRRVYHADTIHPIRAGVRREMENVLISAYRCELEASQLEDYAAGYLAFNASTRTWTRRPAELVIPARRAAC